MIWSTDHFLSHCCECCPTPQIYKDAFEKKFLLATEKLYAAEGQRLINERDIPEYLNHVERRIKEENERLVHYLDPSSKWQLIHMMEKQLLSEHL